MWKIILFALYLNIYLVSCAPTEDRSVIPKDQLTQESNIGGVSVLRC